MWETLAYMVANLQTSFNVKIMVKDPSLLKTRYSGKFRKSDGVVNILDVISRVQYFKVVQKRESNEIELHPNIDWSDKWSHCNINPSTTTAYDIPLETENREFF